MAQVVWTNEAEQWLLKVHDYIAQESRENAFNVVESIFRRAQILEDFPGLGQRHTTASRRDVRVLLWGRKHRWR